jgi:hypothetical protein
MKSLTALWQTVLQEMGHWCSTSTTLDLKKAERRIEHEGLSFLTITLPRFCSDFQKSLEQGKVDRDLFTGFQFRGGLPLFLGGFLDRVFDRGTGRLLDTPDVDSIFAIRQITLMFAKIALPCSDERVKRAIDGYVQCEQEVREADRSMSPELLQEFGRLSLLMFGDVFADVDRKIFDQELVPKHGPGKTADKLLGNKKFDQQEWTTRLERILPYGEYAIPNWRFSYLLDPVHFLEPGEERPVKVVTVPKTLRTPRIIAIEPTCMQYMQQALLEPLVRNLEKSRVSDMIGFTDQTPNQRMALEGSRDEALATLDMSEASDRVSNQHVRHLLRHFPHLFDAVDATRSRKADVPGHGVIRLAKFASMGSALCFPFEAMVFLTVVAMGIQQSRKRRFTRKDIYALSGQVRVYGDDLIVPVDSVPCVIQMLESFGLKVNKDKSYWNGKFRESCGKDYFDGVDITVVRCRRVLPTRRSDVSEMISAISLRNQLYYAGLWETVAYLDELISGLLGHFPVVADTSPALGRHSFLGYETQKMSDELHKPMVKAYVVKSTPPRSVATGEGALLKWFLKRGDEPIADRNHLERQGRPDAVYTKLRWVSSV